MCTNIRIIYSSYQLVLPGSSCINAVFMYVSPTPLNLEDQLIGNIKTFVKKVQKSLVCVCGGFIGISRAWKICDFLFIHNNKAYFSRELLILSFKKHVMYLVLRSLIKTKIELKN